jgi:hypothetical protein
MTKSAGISGLASSGSAPSFFRASHRGQVDHARNARKILQQDARRPELNLLRSRLRVPLADVFDIARFDGPFILEPQQVFEQNSDRIRYARELETAFFQGV